MVLSVYELFVIKRKDFVMKGFDDDDCRHEKDYRIVRRAIGWLEIGY
jgi:hypothetical protein